MSEGGGGGAGIHPLIHSGSGYGMRQAGNCGQEVAKCGITQERKSEDP